MLGSKNKIDSNNIFCIFMYCMQAVQYHGLFYYNDKLYKIILNCNHGQIGKHCMGGLLLNNITVERNLY